MSQSEYAYLIPAWTRYEKPDYTCVTELKSMLTTHTKRLEKVA